jgi:hypothetical protein
LWNAVLTFLKFCVSIDIGYRIPAKANKLPVISVLAYLLNFKVKET